MSNPQDAAVIKELRAQLERAELENSRVWEENTELRGQRAALQHLAYVGAAIRRTFLVEEKNQRMRPGEYTSDQAVVEAGSRAAHRTNVMADLSLFFADVPDMDREATGKNFTKIYGLGIEHFPTMPPSLGDLNTEMMNLQCGMRSMEIDGFFDCDPAISQFMQLDCAIGSQYKDLKENLRRELADRQVSFTMAQNQMVSDPEVRSKITKMEEIMDLWLGLSRRSRTEERSLSSARQSFIRAWMTIVHLRKRVL